MNSETRDQLKGRTSEAAGALPGDGKLKREGQVLEAEVARLRARLAAVGTFGA